MKESNDALFALIISIVIVLIPFLGMVIFDAFTLNNLFKYIALDILTVWGLASYYKYQCNN